MGCRIMPSRFCLLSCRIDRRAAAWVCRCDAWCSSPRGSLGRPAYRRHGLSVLHRRRSLRCGLLCRRDALRPYWGDCAPMERRGLLRRCRGLRLLPRRGNGLRGGQCSRRHVRLYCGRGAALRGMGCLRGMPFWPDSVRGWRYPSRYVPRRHHCRPWRRDICQSYCLFLRRFACRCTSRCGDRPLPNWGHTASVARRGIRHDMHAQCPPLLGLRCTRCPCGRLRSCI